MAYVCASGRSTFYRFELIVDVLASNDGSLVIDTEGTTLDSDNDTELGLYDALGNRIAG